MTILNKVLIIILSVLFSIHSFISYKVEHLKVIPYIVHIIEWHDIKADNDRSHRPNEDVELLVFSNHSFENFMASHAHF